MKSLILSTTVLAFGTIVSAGAFAGSDYQAGQETTKYSSTTETHSSSHAIDQQAQTQQSAEQFNYIDKDANGILNKDEFSSLGTEQDFTKIDVDQDGQITKQEMDDAISMNR